MQVQMEGMRLLLEITRQPSLKPLLRDAVHRAGGEADDALRDHIARTRRRSTTRSARARWAAWWTPSCASTAWRRCAWSTPR